MSNIVGSGPGFLRKLVDYSFTYMVAPDLVKVAYATLVIAGALFFATMVLVTGARDPLAALGLLFFGALGFFIYVVVLRVHCEALIGFFFMVEDIRVIRRGMDSATGQKPDRIGEL